METDVVKILTSLFLLAVVMGVFVQILKNPTGATTAMGATTDAITGITSSLAGGGVNNG